MRTGSNAILALASVLVAGPSLAQEGCHHRAQFGERPHELVGGGGVQDGADGLYRVILLAAGPEQDGVRGGLAHP